MDNIEDIFEEKDRFQLQFRRLKKQMHAWLKKQSREGANKRGNSSRLTQSFHFFPV
uniref:Uncharacterized protein n=1 Tax=Klebsiella pneumoniae TaxID=573 RepID=A0A8B0T092_KLEPN|nr:hypothetical protein [Klebsiella pneumoniae]